MKGWRHRRGLAVGFTATILAIQLSLPIARLAGDSDESIRFGWQMFSSLVPSIEFTVVTSDGEVHVNPDDYLAVLRGDVPIAELLPQHLCRVVEGAKYVTWSTETFTCPVG